MILIDGMSSPMRPCDFLLWSTHCPIALHSAIMGRMTNNAWHLSRAEMWPLVKSFAKNRGSSRSSVLE